MRSRDIKALGGPFAALLWEQWRLTRPVLLLPVVIAIADLGLYAWCSYAFEMRSDVYVDLAAAYIMLLLFLTLMLLLCHPDRRLEMRLVLTPRLLRLPVRPAALVLSSLPLRTALSGIAVYAAFWFHHRMFPQEFEAGVAGMVTAGFLIGFLLLYSVTAIAGVWGDRATGAGILVGLIALFWVGATIGRWEDIFTTEVWYPMWLGVFFSFGLALCGGYLSHALRRRMRGGVAWSLSHSRPATIQSVRDIPRFDGPLTAQRWYEARRVGWALPTLGLLLAIGTFLIIATENANNGNLRLVLEDTFVWPFALLPTCAGLVALATALFDHYLFRKPEGRFLVVRPIHPEIYARARMRVQAGSVGKATLVILTTVIVLDCLVMIFVPESLRIADFANLYPVKLGEESLAVLSTVVALLGALFSAWCIAFLMNRITFVCIILGAAAAILLGPLELVPLDDLIFRIYVAAVSAAVIWSVWVGLRAGLLRPWPILGLLILLPLSSIVALAERSSNTDNIWFFATALAFSLLCFAGAPFGFHLRRSNTLWPRALDVAPERNREWRMALKKVGVFSVCVLLLLGLVHLALARVASNALDRAGLAVAGIPIEKRSANYAVLEEAIAIGVDLDAIINAMPEPCPDREVPGALPRPAQWVWCGRKMDATGAKLQEAVERIVTAQQHPGDTSFKPGQRAVASDTIPYYHDPDYSKLFLTIRGLLSGAYQNARDDRPDEALRYLEAYLFLAEACNAAPYPNDPHFLIGCPMGRDLNDILDKTQFSAKHLARLAKLFPEPPNLQSLLDHYNLNLDAAASYPLGRGGYLDSIQVSAAWRFWYGALAISRLEQYLLAHMILAQTRSLQDMPANWMDYSILTSDWDRFAEQFSSIETLRLTSVAQSRSQLLLARAALAVRRFAAEHEGSLPETLQQPSLAPYLNPDDLKLLTEVDYRIESPDEVELTVSGGHRMELRFPKRSTQQTTSDIQDSVQPDV